MVTLYINKYCDSNANVANNSSELGRKKAQNCILNKYCDSNANIANNSSELRRKKAQNCTLGHASLLFLSNITSFFLFFSFLGNGEYRVTPPKLRKSRLKGR
jgi:hypothetical protein